MKVNETYILNDITFWKMFMTASIIAFPIVTSGRTSITAVTEQQYVCVAVIAQTVHAEVLTIVRWDDDGAVGDPRN